MVEKPTLVLLDTNIYLRLAKRIRPLLGREFGQKPYKTVILKQVEDEVHRSDRLAFYHPWYFDKTLAAERFAQRIRLSKEEKASIEVVSSILNAFVQERAAEFITQYRKPPSTTDCYLLAFGQVRPAIVVTDDLGMHRLAREFELGVWHGYELLKKMLSAKVIDNQLVREIYEALENNGDITQTWREAKASAFKKVFR